MSLIPRIFQSTSELGRSVLQDQSTSCCSVTSDNFRRHPAIAETPEAYASAIIIENLDEIQFTEAEKNNKPESKFSPNSCSHLRLSWIWLNSHGRTNVTPFPIWSPDRYTIVIIDGLAWSSTRSSIRSKARRVPYLSTKTCTSRARLLGSWIKAI